jgi:hypothetical protein
MSAMFKEGVRYRMPTVFGPAPGPRQKADGTMWTREETGIMSCQWMTVSYLTDRSRLEAILPPGFSLRGDPVLSVSLSYFHNLYWLAGRGYGIVMVEFPVTYTGKNETLSGAFCPVMWEGIPDAVMTGREELGFPKLFASIPHILWDPSQGTASGVASWFSHKFLDIELSALMAIDAPKALPGAGGPSLFYKYMPRTGGDGKAGKDVAYVTTSAPPLGSPSDASPIKLSDFSFKKWSGKGSIAWHRARFADLPTSFHIVNALADIEIVEYLSAEMVEFSGPGIGISANTIRLVEPANNELR